MNLKEMVIDFGEGVKLEMVLIPAGNFKMGFTKKDVEDFKEFWKKELKNQAGKELGKGTLDVFNYVSSLQGKQHEVTLTMPFYMGKYAVTQEQWEEVVGNNPSETKGAKLPITNVSYKDCHEFIKKLNSKTDGGFWLPTESEWEYACRAGTTTAYSFGKEMTTTDGNCWGSKIGKPVAVGSYKPNAFGIYDMHGNVWEWCDDWHGEYPFAITDPKGPETGEMIVIRGGSYSNTASRACSAARFCNTLTNRVNNIGFRLARTT